MGFYLITIFAFVAFVLHFTSMLFLRFNPPERWGDKPYPKNKVALLMNRLISKTPFNKNYKIDYFNFIFFFFSIAILFLSILLLVVDLFTRGSITSFLGLPLIVIIGFSILFNEIISTSIRRIVCYLLCRDEAIKISPYIQDAKKYDKERKKRQKDKHKNSWAFLCS